MIKRYYILLILCLLGLSARAQDPAVASFGLGGRSDSLFVRQMQERMAEIRRTRPTVALVLSGGGAKGGAHIGVLKYLQDAGIDIPIDMVVGTSMGGLVGALYSIGYSVQELDSLMRNTDWWFQVGDAVPRESRSYATVQYKEKYALSFPFYYRTEAEDGKYRPLRFSAQNDASSLVKDNLLGSLPSGYYSGQNVNNLISSLTVGYQDSLDFQELPIPFVCVATDLVSARAKVWHDGKLSLAMRSTMSAPGFFAPVRSDGMFLVDGGMRNNFPTDIAKQMGADIVIGVELSDARHGYDDAHNLGDVITMSINLMSNDSRVRNLRIPDVLIKPELSEFNATSFSHDDIAIIVDRGYEAARSRDAELRALQKRIGPYTFHAGGSRKVDIARTRVVLSGVRVDGVDPQEMMFIRSQLNFHAGDVVDRKQIEEAVSKLYGTGYYESVMYELLGNQGPYELVIHCRRGPIHRLGVGLRIDTEEVVSILLNIGLNTNSFGGSSYDFTGKISVNPTLAFHYAYEFRNAPTFNLTASGRFVDRNRFSFNGDLFDIKFNQFQQQVYLSDMRLVRSAFSLGLRNNIFNIKDILSNQVRGDYDYGTSARDFASVFATLRYDSRDESYFPTRGWTVGLSLEGAERIFARSAKPFGIISMDWKQYCSLGGRWALLPALNARFLIGDDIPVPYANAIGGSMDARYLDQQIAFMGITGAAYRRNYLVMGRLDLRYTVAKNNYLTAVVNYARDFFPFDAFHQGSDAFGLGLEYAYNSIVGPLRADIHWSNLSHSLGFYLGLGFDF